MLSNKHKHKSFVFEEELDSSNNKKSKNDERNSKQDSLLDSLDYVKQLKDFNKHNESVKNSVSEIGILIRVSGEEFLLQNECSTNVIKEIKTNKNIFDRKNNVYIFPKWIDKKTFETYLNLEILIRNPNLQFDVILARKMIEIALFLKSEETIKNIIKKL